MKQLSRMAMIWFLILTIGIPSLAQNADQPMIAHFNDAFYLFDGNMLVPYDGCDTQGEPVIGQLVGSPTDANMLINTYPLRVAQVIEEQGGIGGGPLPSNLWRCDRMTGFAERIADQPAEFRFFNGVERDIFTIRSQAVFSPDGTQIAWAEGPYDAPDYTLIIHTIATGEQMTVSLADLPAPDMGIPSPPQVLWSTAGILIPTGRFDLDSGQQIEALSVYNPEGQQISQFDYYATGETTPYVLDRFAAVGDSGGQLLLLLEGGLWGVVDFTSRRFEFINAQPTIISATSPDAGGIIVDFPQDPFSGAWQMVTPDDRSAVYDGYPAGRVAIAPDGLGFAVADSQMTVWSQGQSPRTIPNSEGFADDFSAQIVWGGEVWRIGSSTVEPPPPTTVTQCPNNLPTRLTNGMTARVIQGTVANNVRQSATINSTRIGQIPPGGVFTVIGEPVCADGYTWHNISYGDLVGWTAEGDATTYWLEPVP